MPPKRRRATGKPAGGNRSVREGQRRRDRGFDTLEAGDILFLDGSDRVFKNSDVTVFMIDGLLLQKPSLIVHIQDIALPWNYPDMLTNWYWSEAYILATHLIGAGDRVKPVFPVAWGCRAREFDDWFAKPPVDLGDANDGWSGGVPTRFTHTA